MYGPAALLAALIFAFTVFWVVHPEIYGTDLAKSVKAYNAEMSK